MRKNATIDTRIIFTFLNKAYTTLLSFTWNSNARGNACLYSQLKTFRTQLFQWAPLTNNTSRNDLPFQFKFPSSQRYASAARLRSSPLVISRDATPLSNSTPSKLTLFSNNFRAPAERESTTTENRATSLVSKGFLGKHWAHVRTLRKTSRYCSFFGGRCRCVMRC